MTVQAVPAPRRATARLAFIRALARQTAAIRELRAWRLTSTALDSERERELRLVQGGHPLFEMHFRPSRRLLFDIAGEERVREAGEWGKRWNLDVPGMQAWGVLALLVWDVTRWCTATDCPYGCAASRSDEQVALDLVLSPTAMLLFQEERPLLVDMMAAVAAGADVASGAWLPIERRAVLRSISAPHPLLETKDQYLQYVRGAWDAAVAALVAQGISLSTPRKLELHCDWLVRYHVNGEAVLEILEDLEKNLDTEDTHPSTIYKALSTMAELIELPIRSSLHT